MITTEIITKAPIHARCRGQMKQYCLQFTLKLSECGLWQCSRYMVQKLQNFFVQTPKVIVLCLVAARKFRLTPARSNIYLLILFFVFETFMIRLNPFTSKAEMQFLSTVFSVKVSQPYDPIKLCL